jgi:histone H3/H4
MVRRSPAKRTRIDKSAASTSHNATIFSDESSSDEEAPLPRPRGRPPLEKGGKQPYQSRQSRPVQKTGAARRKSTPRRREIRQLAEMRKLQMQTTSLIPKLPFARLVRYTLGKFGNGFRITQDALAALQESSELYLTGVLGDAFLITLSRRQVTLQPKDINLLMFLRGPASRLQ